MGLNLLLKFFFFVVERTPFVISVVLDCWEFAGSERFFCAFQAATQVCNLLLLQDLGESDRCDMDCGAHSVRSNPQPVVTRLLPQAFPLSFLLIRPPLCPLLLLATLRRRS